MRTRTNSIELEIAIKRAGFTKRKIAKFLGISETSLYNKIKGDREFKISEMYKLSDILKLPSPDVQKNIFLHSL